MIKIYEEKTNNNTKLAIRTEDVDFDYIVEIGQLIQMLIDIGLLEDQPYAISMNCLEEALKERCGNTQKRIRRVRTRTI